MEEQEFQFKTLEKFQMYTPAPGTEGKRSSLVWSSYRGNPRITIFTQIPSDVESHKGVINAAMDPATFIIFTDMFKKIATGPNGSKSKLDCMTLPRAEEGQARSYEKILNSSVIFGKDDEGIVWISVIAANRPNIKFEFKISDFHKFYTSDNGQLTASSSSVLQAVATIDAVKFAMQGHMSDIQKPYDKTKSKTYNKPNTYGAKKPDTSKEFEDIAL